jgi:DNA-binding NtrC family response regulator
MTARILVIDDDQAMCELIRDHLALDGFDVTWCLRGEEGLDLVREKDFDVVITDINLGQMSGIELCKRVRENRADTPVVVITAFGDMSAAVGAMQAGCSDFITKPLEMSALHAAVQRALQRRPSDKLNRLELPLEFDPAAPGMCSGLLLGESREMKQLCQLIRRVARTDTTVLVSGESGTGKEVVARALHAESARAGMPFVAINCAAVPAQLLESELFGHVKGAFTDAKETRRGLFEQAAGGTLLLDEIGEMPLEMQPKLLRVLQERQMRPVGGNTTVPVNARIIAATNRELDGEVAARRFREDLYYRLNVVQIQIPPLRERAADVLSLARQFVQKFAERAQKPISGISDDAANVLLRYNWPGNVRQLENTIERAIALSRSAQIEVEDLPARLREYEGSGALLPELQTGAVLSLDEIEKLHIQRVLQRAKGNKTQTAKVLGVDRRTLYRKLERYVSSTLRESERPSLP